MKKKIFYKGPKLLSIARQKASQLGVESAGVNLENLIHRIQEKEGNAACFRKKKNCPEILCCWQASCGAKMTAS
jgi:hypothetical protein